MLGLRRLYSTAAAAVNLAQETSAEQVASALRRTLKPLNSRKTFLVDSYTHMLRSNSVVLALHNSTLLQNEDRTLRSEIAKAGGQLTIVRGALMRVALRGLSTPDPAAALRKDTKTHPLSPLFNGPSAVVTLKDMDPAALDRIVSVIDKSQNRLVLLGALIQGVGDAVFRQEIDVIRTLPTLPELRAQLAGVLTVLGGAGLTQTLEAAPQALALALSQHAKGDSAEK